MKIELTKEILKNLIMLDECCEELICLIADEVQKESDPEDENSDCDSVM